MKVIFDFAAGKIGIEGDGPQLVEVMQIARQLAPLLEKIEIVTKSPSPSVPSNVIAAVSPASGQSTDIVLNSTPERTGQTLRQFVRGLPLTSISEKVAAIAYFNKSQGTDTFSPKEMATWFTICGLQKPAQMGVALSDAKRKYGYVESTAYMKWKLTVDGENLIVGKLNQVEEEMGLQSA